MNALSGFSPDPKRQSTVANDYWQRSFHFGRLPSVLGRFRKPPHRELFLQRCSETGPGGAPPTHGDDVRTVLSTRQTSPRGTRQPQPAGAAREGGVGLRM